MTALGILKAARETISDPKNWTTGENARDRNGAGCAPKDPGAVCWCVYGAMAKNRGHSDFDTWRSATHAVQAATEGPAMGITEMNDSGDHANVIRVLDRAIKQVEAAK